MTESVNFASKDAIRRVIIRIALPLIGTNIVHII